MTGCYFLLVAATVHRIHTDLTGLYSMVNRYLFFGGGGGGQVTPFITGPSTCDSPFCSNSRVEWVKSQVSDEGTGLIFFL